VAVISDNIIGATGVYLSAEKFGLVPKDTVQNNWNKKPLLEASTSRIADIPFFQELKMSQIRRLTFPFSKDEQDYFEISLNNRDLLVHQYSGRIISETNHPFTAFLSHRNLQLHMGKANFLWSIILLIASASILFFIFSRFAIQVEAVLHQQENFIPLLPLEKIRSKSGDIIHILTPGAQKTRAYSIAKIGSDILLSIKK
jgi:hypothetical protein